MNFLRTMSLQRIADVLKLQLSGAVWKTQSNLNIDGGRNIVFTQTETKDLTTLTVQAGVGGTLGWWGSFWDTTNQAITSTTTAYVIGLNSADQDNDGVTVVGGDKITPTTPAVYNISTSIQLNNTDVQLHDATFWFRKNGIDIPDTASTVTVPNSHGGVDGRTIFYVDLALRLAAGDYIQLVWHATSTAVSLKTLAAGTTPVHPVSPSVLVSVVQI